MTTKYTYNASKTKYQQIVLIFPLNGCSDLHRVNSNKKSVFEHVTCSLHESEFQQSGCKFKTSRIYFKLFQHSYYQNGLRAYEFHLHPSSLLSIFFRKKRSCRRFASPK